MIVCNVPENGPSHIYDRQGRVYRARQDDKGRVVVDLLPEVFRTLLADRNNGLAWHNCNPEALQLLAQS